jgi:hypothetical protein
VGSLRLNCKDKTSILSSNTTFVGSLYRISRSEISVALLTFALFAMAATGLWCPYSRGWRIEPRASHISKRVDRRPCLACSFSSGSSTVNALMKSVLSLAKSVQTSQGMVAIQRATLPLIFCSNINATIHSSVRSLPFSKRDSSDRSSESLMIRAKVHVCSLKA